MISQLRNFGAARENLGIFKNFTISERKRLQFRAEFFNIFNRHEFYGPDMNLSSPTFGQIYTAAGDPRIGQFGVRFDW